MICKKCGAAMPDDSAFCAQCGAVIEVAPEVSAEPIVDAVADPIVEAVAEPFAPAQENNTPPAAEGTPYVYSQPSYSQPVQPQGTPPQYYNAGAQQAPYGETPISSTTYLIFAILVTVMCCLPFGIPAIIYATKIDKLQAMGDFMGAKAAAKSSKMWSIIAGVSIVVLVIAYIALIVFGVAVGGMSY